MKCTYATFKTYGMRSNTVARALDELECYGFIEIERGVLEHKESVHHLISKWQHIVTQEELEAAKSEFDERNRRKKLAADRTRELKAQVLSEAH